MRTHYEILGVGLSATAAEIKAAYRQLAVRYHPDKNNDPLADARIKEINEAYHVLSDLSRKAMYDLQAHWPMAVTRVPPAVHEEPVRRHAPAAEPHKEEFDILALALKYQYLATWVSVGTLIFCSFLFIDYTLAAVKTEEVIVKKYFYRDAEVVETALGKYPIPLYDHVQYAVGQHVEVTSSPLLRIPLYLKTRAHSKTFLPATLYGNFRFAPIVLALCSLLCFYRKLKPHVRLTLGVLNCILFFITTVLIFSIRIIY